MERLYKLNLSKYFRNSRRLPYRPIKWPQWAMNVQVLDKKVSYHKKKNNNNNNKKKTKRHSKWPSKCNACSLKTTPYFKFPKGERPLTPLELIISSSRAEKILFLSFTCEDICVAMVTNMISQLQESFPFRCVAGSFEISFAKWLKWSHQ